MSGPVDPFPDTDALVAYQALGEGPVGVPVLVNRSIPDQARDDHDYWARLCICGLGEQERTGHYPEHMDWCEVPSPMDDDDDPAPTGDGETDERDAR